jgi:hypothetical protein
MRQFRQVDYQHRTPGGDPGESDYQFPPGGDPLVFSPNTWEMRTEGKGELN